MSKYKGPLLTLAVHESLLAVRAAGAVVECSLDLGRSTTTVEVTSSAWTWNGTQFPFLDTCKDRTIYCWDGESFESISRFSNSLIKLVPTEWGAPTFEIDGIKMLPTAQVSPYADAERKVGLIQPRGKVVLDTCGGLGYFAACCLSGDAAQIISFEKNLDVIWLRSLNSWSPDHEADNALTLTNGDVTEHIAKLPDASVDAILHDPPRFGIAGELYSQAFYDQLARVIKPKGRMFHYTGAPNKLTSRRDLPTEVATRLQKAGFATEMNGDGVVAVRQTKK
ncbi:class I SAM-dependent methyltransferase [Stenotrophobium rhamnosiphilum]|uniref:SAM-dependent methyltransferase n=1 Tax=Stenotrophobium rhamnosiphilum TaxID=2029166 RepID=A0A2T5MHW7_9GAMM|nr:MnmC family methyltransferase [Stenotrophobium rhamnosiphilum]PTU32182.1 SAM-dependent methyltransferase [Stenotrophobium rhamnosiphilum]